MWRTRLLGEQVDGLTDEPRPRAARRITDTQVEGVVVGTLESTSRGATHWSTRAMAKATGLSHATIGRIWRGGGLQAHQTETFKLSPDSWLIDKVRDIAGLYVNPPEQAVVICVVEKPQIQALDRGAPLLPMQPSQAEWRTFDYRRHGTTSLFAALDVKTGTVIGELHRRHRSVEFEKFLKRIDAEIRLWLSRHPRFHLHFTPTHSSWLNLVERWFAELTTRQLRRGMHGHARARYHKVERYARECWRFDGDCSVKSGTARTIDRAVFGPSRRRGCHSVVRRELDTPRPTGDAQGTAKCPSTHQILGPRCLSVPRAVGGVAGDRGRAHGHADEPDSGGLRRRVSDGVGALLRSEKYRGEASTTSSLFPAAGAWFCFAAANRKLPPVVCSTVAWCTTRSTTVAAAVGSRKTSDQRANGRFVVTNRLRRSYRSLMNPNSRSAPVLSRGTYPSSSRWTTSKRAGWASLRASRPCCCASTSMVSRLGGGHEPYPVVVLAAGHPQGDGQTRRPRADPADVHDVGGLGDEAAVEDLQDRVAVKVRLRGSGNMNKGPHGHLKRDPLSTRKRRPLAMIDGARHGRLVDRARRDAEVIRMTQWAEVRHLHLVEGVPKKEIARRLKLAVKTGRRAIGRSTPPVRVSPLRPSILDPWRERIRQWLCEEPRLTAKPIRRLLLAGPVPARTVRRYVAVLRAATTRQEAFVHGSVRAELAKHTRKPDQEWSAPPSLLTRQ